MQGDVISIKEDTVEMKKKLKSDIKIVENKLSGIDYRLDMEAGIRSDQKIPTRVVDLEVHVWGTSREPELMVR